MAGDGLKNFLKSKTARILLLCLAALLLLFAVWKVFFGASASYLPTEREARLCLLLSDVEGVGNAKAMVTEENGIPVSAVVLFEGADSVLTRIRVLEITAAALHIDRKYVQVYPAEK